MKKYLPILKRINRLAENTNRQYVKKSSKDFLDCLSQCAKNVLLGNVPLSSRQNVKLRHSKNDLRLLSAKKTSLRKKRQIVQKGGFLAALLPPVLCLLGGALTGIMQDAIR